MKHHHYEEKKFYNIVHQIRPLCGQIRDGEEQLFGYEVTVYRKLAGSTRRCPGHYIKIIKCIVRAKVARKVSPKVLHLLFN